MEERSNDKVKVELAKEKVKHENIYSALSAFQGELKPMAKSGKVQFETRTGQKVDYTYTPLGEIMATIYPMLSKHGLSVRHEVTKEGVEAILTHESYKKTVAVMFELLGGGGAGQDYHGSTYKKVEGSQTLENEIRSGIVKITYGSEMKDTGAAITYARRYTLTMVLGISSEDDKDAELLEQSAKNAIQTVYTRFKAGIEKAESAADIEKSMSVLKKDLVNIEKGKAPALGLAKEQYEDLIKIGESKVEEFKSAKAAKESA